MYPKLASTRSNSPATTSLVLELRTGAATPAHDLCKLGKNYKLSYIPQPHKAALEPSDFNV